MNQIFRRKHLSLVFIVLISGFLWILTLLRLKSFSYQTVHRDVINTTLASFNRRVSKPLDEILRLSPVLSDHVLFFNHVPKTGGEMLVLLLQWLQGSNGFRHIRLPGGKKRKLSRKEQEELVEKVTRHVRDEAVPVTFDRHVYFLNFTAFGRQSPTYINLVRDPIHKALSRFYYARATPNPKNPDVAHAPLHVIRDMELLNYTSFDECVLMKDPKCNFISYQRYDLTIPYFCGHIDICMELNNHWALQRAKDNVERYFTVVGVLEEINSTLTVLENKLPYFFKGVRRLYFDDLSEPHKNKNRRKPQEVSGKVRKILQKSLFMEYEFYYWLRYRLLNQCKIETTSIAPKVTKYKVP